MKNNINNNYISNFLFYSRNKTKEVKIGHSSLGGNHPVIIQTMTNTNTNNIDDTVAQCIRIIKKGADYVRITTQTSKEVESLKEIKTILRNKRFQIPLIADVHFNPEVAEKAAKIVEKVRINPGNYIDKKKGKSVYSEAEYQYELQKINERLKPLIKICKENNTAIRIGINHGSLSERIMLRYGDTPKGMVESALEFLRIFMKESFQNIVVSIKASNPIIMVQANRLLVKQMNEENMHFPIHLGVTEAGEGEDGRIKSAIGIGALLNDGIGDTIRVSLTEAPENEIPVAKKIVNYCIKKENHKPINGTEQVKFNPFNYSKRDTRTCLNIGGNNVPVVILKLNVDNELENLSDEFGNKPDYLFTENIQLVGKYKNQYRIIVPFVVWKLLKEVKENIFPLFQPEEFIDLPVIHENINFVELYNKKYSEIFFQKVSSNNVVFILKTTNKNGYADQRAFINDLIDSNYKIPVIIKREYQEKSLENLQLKSACDIGPLFIDGLADGIFIRNKGDIKLDKIISTSFSILQATRSRISKTEYISCPGCGRTLFNLENTVKEIKQKTRGLKGLKIAIMGCIVNGPGEMADADYGYIGAGPGKVTLYKGKQVVKKNIPENIAVRELISTIKKFGDWREG